MKKVVKLAIAITVVLEFISVCAVFFPGLTTVNLTFPCSKTMQKKQEKVRPESTSESDPVAGAEPRFSICGSLGEGCLP
jgi:hypothetical protein